MKNHDSSNGEAITRKKEYGIRAGDLRRLAIMQHKELMGVLTCLHDMEGTTALKRKCEIDSAFLKAISVIPDNGHVIAVTGLQGVGKSTLANALLGISGHTSSLPEGLLRCEKVPILVRSLLPGEKHQPHWLPLGFSGEAADSLLPISLEEAKRVALGESPDGRDCLLIDWPLPPDVGTSLPNFTYFLVLPGYEKETPWANLGMASMLLADHAIFVVDESSLAQQTTRDLLSEALQRFGRSALTVVFSKMDRVGQNIEQMQSSLNTLGAGLFSMENRNLFSSGIPEDDPSTWQGIAELRHTLFGIFGREHALARTSRVRNLTSKMRQFAEEDLDSLVLCLRSHLEDRQVALLPNQKIFFQIVDQITKAREKANTAARRAVEAEVGRVFSELPDLVSKAVYREASGTTAFFENFNPLQDYDDQQEVRLNRLMRSMVNKHLEDIPIRAAIMALEAFRQNLPESIFASRPSSDREWYNQLLYKGDGIDVEKYKESVSNEFLAASRPIAEAMVTILQKAGKAGDSLNKESLKRIAVEVASTSGIAGLRRGLYALGLVEAVELGAEAAGTTAAGGAAGATSAAGAGSAAGATGAAGASLAVPLAIAAGVILVGVASALCLKAAKDYKVNASRQAGYLVASSEESIRTRLIESSEGILDWFQENLEQGLRQLLGLRRSQDAQYRLAIQCERIALLRSATLKALQMP